jgi:hypothetical protein
MEILLAAVVGSRAYGLDHSESDTDILGVFLAPTLEVAGLNWHSEMETWTDSGPSGDDHTFHELRKFLHLCLKGNPNLMEVLFAKDYQQYTQTGAELVSLRPSFLSQRLQATYLGFCNSNLKAIRRLPSGYEKKAGHTLRLARQGRQLLEEGELTVRVDDPDEYFALTSMDKIDMLRKLNHEFELLREAKSGLPAEPDADPARNFLETVRKNNVLSSVL